MHSRQPFVYIAPKPCTMIAQMPLENFLVIDIETVSGEKHFTLLSEQWQHLWEEKVLRTLPENTTAGDYYPLRAGIMAEFGKVVCISIGYFKKDKGVYQFRVKSIVDHDEKILLQSFIATINQLEAVHKRWNFTGHNIKEFDIPFLCRRMIINGLGLPDCMQLSGKKPWEITHLDTMDMWRFGDFKTFTSLKK